MATRGRNPPQAQLESSDPAVQVPQANLSIFKTRNKYSPTFRFATVRPAGLWVLSSLAPLTRVDRAQSESSPGPNSLSVPQTQSECVQSRNSTLQTGVMSVPSPTSSLTSNYNDDLVYFHSLAFRRLSSRERRAIRSNKSPPPYREGRRQKQTPP